MAAVVAVPFGLIALRVRRHTFVVVTIAVFFIFQLMAFNLSWSPAARPGSSRRSSLGRRPRYNKPFYYVALIIAVATALSPGSIRRSRFGLQLRAIRDDEDRARGLGVQDHAGQADRVRDLRLHRSGWSAGCGSTSSREALPQYAFNPLFDLTVALMAFLGGFGTLSGPMLGALLLEPLQQ